jgi:flagellar hook-basal body complex protein FliE
MNSVNNLGTYSPLMLRGTNPAAQTEAAGSSTFKDLLVDSIKEVNSMQQAADRAVEKLAVGEDVNPAEVLTAVQKADIAFKLMMQMRNKMVQAYQEIQNIRV